MGKRNLVRRILGSPVAAAALVGLLLSPLGGCVHHVHSSDSPSVRGKSHGPPPHAPAHGYRHRRHGDGVELVFDAGLDVYVVVGLPGHYWHADRYLRWTDSAWSVSYRIDGDWVAISSDRIPPGLAHSHARRHKKSKHPHKGWWPAKHGY